MNQCFDLASKSQNKKYSTSSQPCFCSTMPSMQYELIRAAIGIQMRSQRKPNTCFSDQRLRNTSKECLPARGIQRKTTEFVIALRSIIPKNFFSCYKVAPLLTLHLRVENITFAVSNIVLPQHTSCRTEENHELRHKCSQKESQRKTLIDLTIEHLDFCTENQTIKKVFLKRINGNRRNICDTYDKILICKSLLQIKMKTSKSPVENEQGTEMFIHKRSNIGQ